MSVLWDWDEEPKETSPEKGHKGGCVSTTEDRPTTGDPMEKIVHQINDLRRYTLQKPRGPVDWIEEECTRG